MVKLTLEKPSKSQQNIISIQQKDKTINNLPAGQGNTTVHGL